VLQAHQIRMRAQSQSGNRARADDPAGVLSFVDEVIE
jgi:hypothetical protein